MLFQLFEILLAFLLSFFFSFLGTLNVNLELISKIVGELKLLILYFFNVGLLLHLFLSGHFLKVAQEELTLTELNVFHQRLG